MPLNINAQVSIPALTYFLSSPLHCKKMKYHLSQENKLRDWAAIKICMTLQWLNAHHRRGLNVKREMNSASESS